MAIKKQRFFASGYAVDVFADRQLQSDRTPVVVVLPGFPDFPGPSALTPLLTDLGIRVLQPHLAGTYDSPGAFSLAGAADTLSAVSQALSAGIWTAPGGEVVNLGWTPTKLGLVGHSFGGIFALRCFPALAGLDLVIFTSAAIHYAPSFGCHEVGPEHYGSVGLSHPRTYRLAPMDAWAEVMSGVDPAPSKPIGHVPSVRILYGEKDKYFDVRTAVERAPALVAAYTGCNDIQTTTVIGGGHPLAELLPNVDMRGVLSPLFKD